MLTFVVAVVVAIVVAVGFALVLNIFQEPAASAFSTEAVRL
jgi:Na+-driven multidrug efflux pump